VNKTKKHFPPIVNGVKIKLVDKLTGKRVPKSVSFEITLSINKRVWV